MNLRVQLSEAPSLGELAGGIQGIYCNAATQLLGCSCAFSFFQNLTSPAPANSSCTYLDNVQVRGAACGQDN